MNKIQKETDLGYILQRQTRRWSLKALIFTGFLALGNYLISEIAENKKIQKMQYEMQVHNLPKVMRLDSIYNHQKDSVQNRYQFKIDSLNRDYQSKLNQLEKELK